MDRLKKTGMVKAVNSAQVGESVLGLGFEKLDRGVFDPEKAYDKVAELGIKWIRIQSGWARTEQRKGVYDFAWFDSIVENLLRRGLRPWVCLCYGNGLYDEAAAKVFGAVGCPPIHNEEQKKAWHDYVVALVSRYRGKIGWYEVWNEPYSKGFWLPGPPSQSEYVELVKLTAEVIRGILPEAKIIGGNTGTELWFAPCIEEYMKLGLGRYLDVYSYHRYRVMPEIETPEWINFYRAIFKKYGADHLELWQGEAGFPSVTSETEALAGVPMNEEIQARLLLRSLLTDLYLENDYTSYFTRTGSGTNPIISDCSRRILRRARKSRMTRSATSVRFSTVPPGGIKPHWRRWRPATHWRRRTVTRFTKKSPPPMWSHSSGTAGR